MREYGLENFLSMSESSEVKVVPDIGDVIDDEGDEVAGGGREAAEGEIIAVREVEEYSSCVSCKGRLNSISHTTGIGECSKCKAKVKMSRCRKKLIVKFIVELFCRRKDVVGLKHDFLL